MLFRSFDSYLYKRVVAMNPWQQLKLTFKTLASVLRGQALAPSGYRPVPSQVRSEAEVRDLEPVSAIRGGIRVNRAAAPSPGQTPAGQRTAQEPRAEGSSDGEREPVLSSRP